MTGYGLLGDTRIDALRKGGQRREPRYMPSLGRAAGYRDGDRAKPQRITAISGLPPAGQSGIYFSAMLHRLPD